MILGLREFAEPRYPVKDAGNDVASHLREEGLPMKTQAVTGFTVASSSARGVSWGFGVSWG